MEAGVEHESGIRCPAGDLRRAGSHVRNSRRSHPINLVILWHPFPAALAATFLPRADGSGDSRSPPQSIRPCDTGIMKFLSRLLGVPESLMNKYFARNSRAEVSGRASRRPSRFGSLSLGRSKGSSWQRRPKPETRHAPVASSFSTADY